MKNIRIAVLLFALLTLIFMDIYLLYLGYKMQVESGIAVGLGIVELFFFSLGIPISLMALLLKPGLMYRVVLGMVWAVLIYCFISY